VPYPHIDALSQCRTSGISRTGRRRTHLSYAIVRYIFSASDPHTQKTCLRPANIFPMSSNMIENLLA
jgi:hypothetical protein